MKEKHFCPECLEEQSFTEVSYDETFNVKQEEITVNSSYLRCTECKEEILIPGKEDDNIKQAYDIYRIRKNLLFPEQIKKIRKSYNLSQRTLAKILGWSHATLSRYETGALQSTSHNNELALIENPSNMLMLLDVNKDNISDFEYDEIRRDIFDKFNENNVSLKFSKETYHQLSLLANDNFVDVETLAKEYITKGVQNSIDTKNIISYLQSNLQPNLSVSFNFANKEIREIIDSKKHIGRTWRNPLFPVSEFNWRGVHSVE